MTEENEPQPYGPANPHPLSTIKTELIWEGKYDEYGNRRPVHLPSTPYPLQKIEAIDDPVVLAKQQFTSQMAFASGMTYEMIKGTDADAGHYASLFNNDSLPNQLIVL